MAGTTRYVMIPAWNYNRLQMWSWFLDPARTTLLDQDLYWRLQQMSPDRPPRRPSIRLLPFEVDTLLGWFDRIPAPVQDPSDAAYAEVLASFIDPDCFSA